MKVLILGATGLVGQNALALLLSEVIGWRPDAAIRATGTTRSIPHGSMQTK